MPATAFCISPQTKGKIPLAGTRTHDRPLYPRYTKILRSTHRDPQIFVYPRHHPRRSCTSHRHSRRCPNHRQSSRRETQIHNDKILHQTQRHPHPRHPLHQIRSPQRPHRPRPRRPQGPHHRRKHLVSCRLQERKNRPHRFRTSLRAPDVQRQRKFQFHLHQRHGTHRRYRPQRHHQ